ncbi:MAG TPA: Gfo/Idh/MocA family oxidoreductase [Anaerolineales bacterium]|nr:Gfo/Idh/MocA family oxidoreductase [Anaerolineales bacterium]
MTKPDSIPPIIVSALEHRLPPKTDYGIAFIGCGGIVNYGHIPSYKTNGFNLIGGYDIHREAAEKTVQVHGLKKVYSSPDELLSDPAVQIVDVAVVPSEQRKVVEKVIASGKHLLCQKPFSTNYTDAVAMTGLAQQAGLKMAIHQQFRWSSIIQATRALMAEGWLGEILDVQVQVSIHTPWEMWPWIASQPRLEVLFHSIHYLDSLRFLFGDPALVTSRHTRHPEQQAKGETKTITTWEYANGLQILIAICHFDWSPALYSLFRVLGTEGVIEGTIGTNYDYPDGRNDTLKFTSRTHPDQNFESILPGKWIPDAFYGPMASLMQAIQTDGEPVTSARDNLGTLRVVNAAYRSMTEARSVSPTEIVA